MLIVCLWSCHPLKLWYLSLLKCDKNTLNYNLQDILYGSLLLIPLQRLKRSLYPDWVFRHQPLLIDCPVRNTSKESITHSAWHLSYFVRYILCLWKRSQETNKKVTDKQSCFNNLFSGSFSLPWSQRNFSLDHFLSGSFPHIPLLFWS